MLQQDNHQLLSKLRCNLGLASKVHIMLPNIRSLHLISMLCSI